MIDNDSLSTQSTENQQKAAESTFEFSWDMFYDKAIEWGINLLTGILILVIGFMIVKRMVKLSDRLLQKRKLDGSLRSFLSSMISISLKIMVVISALSALGVEMTSFIALIGAAGLAIGMAFSGTLGNLAGGVMILVFRPYKVDDVIEAQGETGTVKEIQIFNTILWTFDNKTIIIPNGALANGNITNYTEQKTRRVDFAVGIGYGDKYDTAVEVLNRFIEEDERILKDPEPFIGLSSLGDSSVNIALRVWCKTEDYWDIYYKMNERIYKEFDDADLSIPFPQMDVHLHKEE